MLYAIFFLLLIVFFPLVSLFLGVGFMVALVKFWWAFLILFGCLIFCRYIDKKEAREKEDAKLKKQQEAIIGAIRGGQADQSNNHTKLTYRGEPELSNDSYVLYISKKHAIEKNAVLGRYVLNEKLYSNLNEVLDAANQLEQEEGLKKKKELDRLTQEVKENEKINNIALIERQKSLKHLAIFLAITLPIISVALYFSDNLYSHPFRKVAEHSSLESNPMRSIRPSFDCSKAKSVAETLICSDNELAAEDNEMFELYKLAKLKTLNPGQFKTDNQILWKYREKNCVDKRCLLDWFAARKEYFQRIINEESEYSKFSRENQELIKQWYLKDSDSHWGDESIRERLNRQEICYGIKDQPPALYGWHKCSPKSFKDY